MDSTFKPKCYPLIYSLQTLPWKALNLFANMLFLIFDCKEKKRFSSFRSCRGKLNIVYIVAHTLKKFIFVSFKYSIKYGFEVTRLYRGVISVISDLSVTNYSLIIGDNL